MPECRLYTIQGEKQLFVVRLSCEPGPACYSSSGTANFTSYLSNVTQVINSANSKMVNVPCKSDSEHHLRTQMQQKCFLNLFQALLNNSHLYHQAKADFKNRGIEGKYQIKMLFIIYLFILWQCTTNICLFNSCWLPAAKKKIFAIKHLTIFVKSNPPY